MGSGKASALVDALTATLQTFTLEELDAATEQAIGIDPNSWLALMLSEYMEVYRGSHQVAPAEEEYGH